MLLVQQTKYSAFDPLNVSTAPEAALTQRHVISHCHKAPTSLCATLSQLLGKQREVLTLGVIAGAYV